MVILPRCQRQAFVATHTLAQRLHGRVYRGFGIRAALKRVLGLRKPTERLGKPSVFAPGEWVRILEEPRLREILDTRARTRGLLFSPQQSAYCGRVARVARVVRRIVDDDGRFRAVSRTVLLEGITCAGIDGMHGCGRICPLLFRDEWLERADAPLRATDPAPPGVLWARVRSLAEIAATLDRRGRHGAVLFTPDMRQYAGRRFQVVRKLGQVFEADRDAVVEEPIYVLAGPACDGEVFGTKGPCHRGCALLWHQDWLELDAADPDAGA
jgi:hypothetical protein